MTWRVTQKALDFAIERLAESSGLNIRTNNCYGYSQLGIGLEHGGIDSIEATFGDSKKDLYYQIQFYLQMKSMERKYTKS